MEAPTSLLVRVKLPKGELVRGLGHNQAFCTSILFDNFQWILMGIRRLEDEKKVIITIAGKKRLDKNDYKVQEIPMFSFTRYLVKLPEKSAVTVESRENPYKLEYRGMTMFIYVR